MQSFCGKAIAWDLELTADPEQAHRWWQCSVDPKGPAYQETTNVDGQRLTRKTETTSGIYNRRHITQGSATQVIWGSLDGKQGSVTSSEGNLGRKPCPPETGETEGRDSASRAQCTGNQAGLCSESWSCCQRRHTRQRHRRGNVLLLPPPSSLFSVPPIGWHGSLGNEACWLILLCLRGGGCGVDRRAQRPRAGPASYTECGWVLH